MKYTNNHDIPEAFFLAISNDGYDIKRDDQNIISISDLISPPRIRQLRIRHWDYLETDVSEMGALFQGNAIHKIVENINSPYYIIEKRLKHDIDGCVVAGKPDIYRLDNLQIEDNKTSTSSSWLREPTGKLEWIQQLNCYALLYRMTGFDVNSLQINAFITDWNKYKTSNPNYPQQKMLKIPIPLWQTDETIKFVKDRIELHKNAMDIKDNNLPLCTPDERWRQPDLFKLYKKDGKRALMTTSDEKIVDDLKSEMESKNPKYKYDIVKEESIDKRCQTCIVKKQCNYWEKNYGG